MEWHPDLNYLNYRLADLYPSVGEVRGVITRAGLQNNHIDFTGDSITLWSNVLRYAINSTDWFRVIALVDTVIKPEERGKDDNKLKNILDSFRNRQESNIPELSYKPKLVLSDKLFMLDRDSVRDKLALLTDNTAQEKVLLIRGSKKSGKSHLRFLFEEHAKLAGASFLYLAAGKVNDVRQTIDQLFVHFNRLNDVPPMETTPDAWYKKVSLKLKEIAATQPYEDRRPLWIAMDDLGVDEKGQPILPTEVLQFFNQFALNMDNENFHRWFRLMLINYPDTIPTEWAEDLWTNPDTPVQETDIQAQHVADCLRAWAESQKRNIPPDDLASRSNSLINTVDTQYPQPGQELAPRLRRIHDELKRTINELKAQPVV